MKESKYIELLNLYIDREIGPQELALLEEEIRHSPEHRRLFQQYCRMHKGCLELAVNFQPAQERKPRVRMAEPSRPDKAWRPWQSASALAAGALAAACVALVLVLDRNPGESGGLNDTVLVPSGELVAGTDSFGVRPQFVSGARKRQELQPVLATGALASLSANAEPVFATASQDQFDWMKQVQPGASRLVVPVEDLVFETSKTTLQTDYRVFKGNRTFQGPVEMTAFQFQR